MSDVSDKLENAPVELKLAIDLIYLLESNEVKPAIALEALKIVERDLERKIKVTSTSLPA